MARIGKEKRRGRVIIETDEMKEIHGGMKKIDGMIETEEKRGITGMGGTRERIGTAGMIRTTGMTRTAGMKETDGMRGSGGMEGSGEMKETGGTIGIAGTTDTRGMAVMEETGETETPRLIAMVGTVLKSAMIEIGVMTVTDVMIWGSVATGPEKGRPTHVLMMMRHAP